jgi:zinc-ribbon domain
MSSETSTDTNELPPWVFFALAAFGCATALLFVGRDNAPTNRMLLTVLMATTFLVGIAALRTLRPLFSSQDDRTPTIEGRTRAAFEREKLLTLRAIKDLEFDRAMGKLSQADFVDMSGRLRARAGRLIKTLDAGSGYREQVERDLAKRLQVRLKPDATDGKSADGTSGIRLQPDVAAGNFCTQCGTKNDGDARFCKSCGHKL